MLDIRCTCWAGSPEFRKPRPCLADLVEELRQVWLTTNSAHDVAIRAESGPYPIPNVTILWSLRVSITLSHRAEHATPLPRGCKAALRKS